MANQYMQEEDDAILKTYNRYPVVLDHGIGLGVMGQNLALNLANKGWKVVVWNRTVPGKEETW